MPAPLQRGSTRQMLLADTERQMDAPTWVTKFIVLTSVFRRGPMFALLTLQHFACFAFWAYSIVHASFTAGLVHEKDCAPRAGLFAIVLSLVQPVDWLATFLAGRNEALPNAWVPSKEVVTAVHRTLQEAGGAVVVSIVLTFIPVVLWVREGIDTMFVLGAIAGVLGVTIHSVWIAVTFNFWIAHHELAQGRFTKRLITGELGYEQAVAEYATINNGRKAVSGAMKLAGPTMATYLLGMAVVLYDFEIRPWGTWPLVVFFITNALCVRCDRPIHPKTQPFPCCPPRLACSRRGGGRSSLASAACASSRWTPSSRCTTGPTSSPPRSWRAPSSRGRPPTSPTLSCSSPRRGCRTQGSYSAHLTRHPCTLLTVACHLYLSVCLCRRCP